MNVFSSVGIIAVNKMVMSGYGFVFGRPLVSGNDTCRFFPRCRATCTRNFVSLLLSVCAGVLMLHLHNHVILIAYIVLT